MDALALRSSCQFCTGINNGRFTSTTPWRAKVPSELDRLVSWMRGYANEFLNVIYHPLDVSETVPCAI